MQKARDERLIFVGIDMFGTKGLEGVSTRELAAAAGRPMSTITYQFGGKEGLYLACAEHIATTIGALIGGVIEDNIAVTAAEARAQVLNIIRALTATALRDETAPFARFVMCEQQEPTAAFDIFYSGVMGRILRRLTDLLCIISGDRLSLADARLQTVMLMGQVMAFRVARAAVLRLNEWDEIGDEQRLTIDTAIQASINAILDSIEREYLA